MLSWKVIMEDKGKIVYYDIFENNYLENLAKRLKELCPVFQNWSDAFRQKLKNRYWSKSEYEIIVTSWPPYIKTQDIDKLKERVIEREKTFGTKPQRVTIMPEVVRKIDIFEQLEANWGPFTKYVWERI